MDCLIKILDLIIKSVVVIGICFLVINYIRVATLDYKIEKINKSYEKERDIMRKNPQGWFGGALEQNLELLKRKTDDKLAPLQRKRERILSIIPFLK